MTMTNNLCDVCKTRPPVGVASTAIPLSVAYCQECARRNAQPVGVFEYWEDDIPPRAHRDPGMVTYIDGRYVSYREWYKGRHKK